jgi:DNA-binding NarL/FixJ family response regulator
VSTATRYIRKVSPHTRIIVLRSRQQGAAANRSSRSMVMTVPTRAPFKDLVAVLRQTAQNVDTGAPGTARPGTKAGKNTRAKPAITNTLTVRQREIIAMIADGYSVKEAALRLKLSHKTVETHRRAIMTKLGLRNTADITRYALREGLTSL